MRTLLRGFLFGVLLIAGIGIGIAQGEFTGVTTSAINVREDPGTGAAIITVLPITTTIIIEGRNAPGDWLLMHRQDNSVRGPVARRYVKLLNGNITFLLVSNEHITSAGGSPPAAPDPVENTGVITAVAPVNLNVRDIPSTRGNRIGLLTAATTVTLQGRNESGDWVYISGGRLQGWVACRYLRLPRNANVASLPVITAQPTVVVNNPPASTPSTSGDAIPPVAPEITSGGPIVLTPAIITNSRAVFQRGRSMGNIGSFFIKVSDSNMANYEYLCNFGRGAYDLGIIVTSCSG